MTDVKISDLPAGVDDDGTAQIPFVQTGRGTVRGTIFNLLKPLLGTIGTSLIGMAFGPGTLADYLAGFNSLSKYGTLHNDGVTDDSATVAAAIASGHPFIDARGLNLKLDSTLNIASNQIWLLAGTKLNITGSAFTLFSAITANDWGMIGPCRVIGDLVTDPGTSVTSKGILIQDCARFLMREIHFEKIKGYGVYVAPGGSTRARADGGQIVDCSASSCVWGTHDDAGTGSEYITFTNWRGTQNAQASIETSAGNVQFIGGHSVDNIRDGVRLVAGPNNCHGSFTGHYSNHNPGYNWWANGVTNGETFTGCHSYASAPGQGAIYFQNSRGMAWNGGTIDSWIYNDSGASSGANTITDAFFPGDVGVTLATTVSGSLAELFVRGCFNKTGPSNLNDPAPLCVLAARSSNFALTAGSAVVIQLDSESVDNRNIYVPGTGVATVPAWAGGQLFTCDLNLAVTATSGLAAGGFVEVRVNGGVVGNGALVAINGALATYQGSISFVPPAGAAIDVRVTANAGAVSPVLSTTAHSVMLLRCGV